MNTINKIFLIGRLGNKPISRTTKNGHRLVTFSLATQDFIKSKNERETTWHRIVAWGQAADYCESYLNKGDMVYLDGSMKVRKYEQDGKMNYVHEVQTFSVKGLLNKASRTENSAEENETNEAEALATESEMIN